MLWDTNADVKATFRNADFVGYKKVLNFAPNRYRLIAFIAGMDGYAVASALRSSPTLRDIPIIAVTSYAMTGDNGGWLQHLIYRNAMGVARRA